MLKRLLATTALVLFSAFAFSAFAVEVNSADKAALDGVKDIGPKTAEAIIAERSKNGKFKDWDDLVNRVKGIGPKNSDAMSKGGLTVNGQSKPNAPASTARTAAQKDAPKSDAGKSDKPEATADEKKGKRTKKADDSKDDKPESKK